jgi:hypothetical protein
MFKNRCAMPLLLAVVIIVVIAVAVIGRASPLSFKNDLLTQVMPNLLAGLFAIAAITERAVAVLNNIWFGEEREQHEDKVRLTSKQLEATRAEAVGAMQAHGELVREAIRAGNNQVLAKPEAAAFTAKAATVDNKVAALAADLEGADKELAAIEAKRSRAKLVFGFIVALFVSAVGVRTLQSMFDVSNLSRDQTGILQAVDILLTAAVLAGGTSAISAITDLLGTYVNASRKRALERS